MASFQPSNPNFAAWVRESFARQGLMHTLGIELARIEAGMVELRAGYRADLAQQHAFFHGALVGAALDSAGGYAALTLMPHGSEVLSVEYKINFTAAAEGEELIARGQVLKPGRTITVSESKAYCLKDGMASLCAVMLQTLIRTEHN